MRNLLDMGNPYQHPSEVSIVRTPALMGDTCTCTCMALAWARRATEQGLARAVWEGLRTFRLPPNLSPLSQIRFGFS